MEEVAICPACAMRDVSTPSGFCAECVVQRTREKYGEKQRAATINRREAWSERSSNEWDRDRQRVHRLRKLVTPKEPPRHEDPWELAYEALRLLDVVRSAITKAEQHDRLDQIAEALRRLAWGPTDGEVKPEPTKAALEARARRARKAAERDRSGWDGQWRHIG